MSKYVKILILLLFVMCFVGCKDKNKDDNIPKLKSMSVTKGYLYPEFSPDTKEYILYFDKEDRYTTILYEAEEYNYVDRNSQEIYNFEGDEINIEVMSADLTLKTKYKVILRQSKNKIFNEFTLSDGINIFNGEINGSKVFVNIPETVDKTKLIAKFVFEENSDEKKVYVNEIEQISGVTQNDFTDTVEYKIKDKNEQEKVYSIITPKYIKDFTEFTDKCLINREKWYFTDIKAGEPYYMYFLYENGYTGSYGMTFYEEVENKFIEIDIYNKLVYSNTDKRIYIKVYNTIADVLFVAKKINIVDKNIGEEIFPTADKAEFFAFNFEENKPYTIYKSDYDSMMRFSIYDENFNCVYDNDGGNGWIGYNKIYTYFNKKAGKYYIAPIKYTESKLLSPNFKLIKDTNYSILEEGKRDEKEITNCLQYSLSANFEKNRYYIFEYELDGKYDSINVAYISKDRIIDDNTINIGDITVNGNTNIFSLENTENYFISISPNLINKKISSIFVKANIEDLIKDGKSYNKELSNKVHSNYFRLNVEAGKTYKILFKDKNSNAMEYSGNIKEVVAYPEQMLREIDVYRYYQKMNIKEKSLTISSIIDQNYLINVNSEEYGENIGISVEEITTGIEGGAFKIVNSWGKGSWEYKADGFYNLSYAAAKQLGRVYVLEPNKNNNIKALAVLNIEHYRKDCAIEISTGEGENYRSKKISFDYITSENDIKLPNGNFIIDISDILPIENNKISLKVQDYYKPDTTGKINYFAIETYEDYSKGYSSKYICDTLPCTTINGETINCSIEIPVSSVLKYRNVTIENTLLKYRAEKKIKSNRSMVKTEYVKDEKLYRGTGLKFLPENKIVEYEKAGKIFQIDTSKIINKNLKRDISEKIDLSETKYFPPIGDQLHQGSCVAWSMGYYIMTYNLAKERNIDLKSAKYDLMTNSFLNYSTYIMSPAFLYNLENGGEDIGMEPETAVDILSNIGLCSWEKKPYYDSDCESLGSEEMWREAIMNRASSVNAMGYMDINTEEDIEALKILLQKGYLISIAINAYDLYYLDENDFLSSMYFDNSYPNHMNTIVGYDDTISGGR